MHLEEAVEQEGQLTIVHTAVVQVHSLDLRLQRLLDRFCQAYKVAAIQSVSSQDKLAIDYFVDEGQCDLLLSMHLLVVD